MTSLTSLDKAKAHLKQYILTKVKPWLNECVETPGDLGLIDIETAYNFFVSLSVIVPSVLPSHDSSNHGEDVHRKRFCHATLSSLNNIKEITRDICKSSKEDPRKDAEADELHQRVIKGAGARVCFVYAYDVYRQLKENKELCDAVFDQDRDFWKSL